MMIPGFIIVSAFLLVGLGATRTSKGALYMTAGSLLFVIGAAMHVTMYEGFVSLMGTMSAELGIGCILVAGMLTKHGKQGRPFFVIGATSLLMTVLIFASVQLFTASDAEPQEQASHAKRHGEIASWLVELGEDDDISEIEQLLNVAGASWEEAFPSVSMEQDADLAQVYIIRVEESASILLANALRADKENVDHVELNFMVQLEEPVVADEAGIADNDLLENDPLASQQWALDAINGHAVHRMLENTQPIRKAIVAILDTGVDARHEDVSGTFTDSPATVDIHGHGSHCAGIAGAITNNGTGIASLNWEGRFLDIAGYQALNEQGFGSIEMISQAIIDAAQDKVDVISMSLGAKAQTPKVISDAIAFARRSKVIVLASAGNSNEDAIDHMPSGVEGVIVVSAVDENLDKAKFSNTNTSLARPITAPGVNILSLKTGGGYVTMSGTSMSTPVVSGIVGMMRAMNPDITDDQVWDILQSTGRDVKDTQRIGRLIDAEAAIKKAMDLR